MSEQKPVFKACLFDLDGTLANTLESIANFCNTALSRVGFPPIERDVYKILVGNGADLLMRRMLARSVPPGTEVPEELVRRTRKIYDALYESDPLHLVTPYEGIPETLRALKSRGIQLAVFSNKPDDMTQIVVRELLGEGLFTAVQGQIDGIPAKPDPTVPRLLLVRMGVTAEECLYIGDTGTDMDTGRNAGMTTAGALWGFRDRRELLEHGAVYLLSHPSEILDLVP